MFTFAVLMGVNGVRNRDKAMRIWRFAERKEAIKVEEKK